MPEARFREDVPSAGGLIEDVQPGPCFFSEKPIRSRVAPLVKENRHMLRASRRLKLAFFCSTASMLLLVVQVAPR
jgi:hypothetical protein